MQISGVEDTWEPSFDTRSTLRQLGFSKTSIKSALTDYLSTVETPCDESFRQYVAERENYQAPLVDLRWTPKPETMNVMLEAGYTLAVINYYRDMFLLEKRENKDVLINPDAAFQKFIRRLCSTNRVQTLSKASWLELRLGGMSPSEIRGKLKLLKSLTGVHPSTLSEEEVVRSLKTMQC